MFRFLNSLTPWLFTIIFTEHIHHKLLSSYYLNMQILTTARSSDESEKLRSSWFYNFCSPLLQIQLQITHSVLNHVYGINSLFHFSSLTQTVLLLIHLISLKTDRHFLSTHQSHHLSLPSLFLLLEQNSPVSPILPITDNWFPAKLLSYRLLCVDLFYLFHFVNFLLWFHAVYKAGCPEVFLSYGWPVQPMRFRTTWNESHHISLKQ